MNLDSLVIQFVTSRYGDRAFPAVKLTTAAFQPSDFMKCWLPNHVGHPLALLLTSAIPFDRLGAEGVAQDGLVQYRLDPHIWPFP